MNIYFYYQQEMHKAVEEYFAIVKDGEVCGLDEIMDRILYCFARLGV